MFKLVYCGRVTAQGRDKFCASKQRATWALTKHGMTERDLRKKLDWSASFFDKYERDERKYAIRDYFQEERLDIAFEHKPDHPYVLFEYVEEHAEETEAVDTTMTGTIEPELVVSLTRLEILAFMNVMAILPIISGALSREEFEAIYSLIEKFAKAGGIFKENQQKDAQQ